MPGSAGKFATGFPASNGRCFSIVGAMDHTGMLATMTVQSATDGDVFLAFLDQVLCPKLCSGTWL